MTLIGLIDRHGEEIYADFRQYYGLNAQSIIDGSLPPREAIVLIRQLPAESRTVAAMNGIPEGRGWGVAEHLMAAVIDAVNANTFAFISANSKRKPKQPKPVWTPAQKKRKQDAKKNNLFAVQLNNELMKLKKKEA